MDFQPSIHVFDEEVDTALNASSPAAPELLLFDRWSLLNPHKRDLARKFDQVNPGWVTMLRPWCRNDPQQEQGERLLRDLEAETFVSRRRGVSKPSFDDIHLHLPTIDTFSEVVPKAAVRAWHAYQSHGRTVVPVVPAGAGAAGPTVTAGRDRSAPAKPDLSAARSRSWTGSAGHPPVPTPPTPAIPTSGPPAEAVP
jgi:FxsC-like protein